MMPAAEDFSNFVQGGFGSLPGQIHSHLAREHDIRVEEIDEGHVAGAVRRHVCKSEVSLALAEAGRRAGGISDVDAKEFDSESLAGEAVELGLNVGAER